MLFAIAVPKDVRGSVLKSESFAFPKTVRISERAHFQQVFAKQKKLWGSHCILYYCHNELGHPRLGIIASKRKIRLATQRNRFKRVVRDRFRHQQAALNDFDIVILARESADKVNKQRLATCINELFLQLIGSSNKY